MKSILLGATAASVLVVAVPALAQEAPLAQVAAPTSPDASDIIVTARKRQESILRVPVVETAITQAQLEKFQISNLTAVAARVPGLVIGQGVLSIGTQISIRGVGTSSLDAGVDQSVSLNIDGLQLSQGLAYKVGTFDLAQAEILKGPQALFFGKSSPGGVISLRTADPTNEVEVIGRASYEFESHQRRFDGIISGPITDTFLVRAAVSYSKDNGYFKNVAVAQPGFGGVTPTHRDIPTESIIARGTAIWKPDPSFSARLKVNYARDRVEGNGGEGQWTSCPDGVGRAPLPPTYRGVTYLGGNEDCKIDRKENYVWADPAAFPGIRNGGEPFSFQTQKFGTLELNYVPAQNITLTSVTGYYDLVQDSMINGIEATYAGPSLTADNHFTRKDFTQEVRLNSDYSGPINFTLGAFYQKSTARNRLIVQGNLDEAFFPPALPTFPRILTAGRNRLGIESYSGFGQLRYKIVPRLELSGGVRYTHERRTFSVFNDTPSFPDGPPTSTGPHQVPIATPAISSGNYSPELTLTWTPTDDLTVFGSLKQAYKSGSFSQTTIPDDGADNSFGDEKVQGGEAGVKSRLLDRQVTLNLAGYYYHYKGLQVGTNSESAGGVPQLRTLNAGSANIYGVDFDMNYRPAAIRGLDLHTAVNWNHARFKSLEGVPCVGGQSVAEGCNQVFNPTTGAFTAQSLSGSRLVRAPTWQVNFGFDYEVEVGNGMNLTLSSGNRYSSRYKAGLPDRSDFFQGAYFETDASVSLRGLNSAWEVALIGNNLTDKLTTGNCTNLSEEAGQVLGSSFENTGRAGARGLAGIDEINCQFNRGREVFLRLTLRPNRLFK